MEMDRLSRDGQAPDLDQKRHHHQRRSRDSNQSRPTA
jgi:hypothetical protein